QLPDPFFVIATQNPLDQVGTFPLPESQLDRFLMCIELGYPDPASERTLLAGQDRRELLAGLNAKMQADELLAAQRQVSLVRCAGPLLDYVQQLLAASRRASRFAEGLSPRAGLAIVQAARAWAMLDGRDHVLPDDVQAVMQAVAGHRLRPSSGSAASHRVRAELVAELLHSVSVR
ncbi:MAG: MoxR family ATPase, partial [Quisquiliibacterium sp.]